MVPVSDSISKEGIYKQTCLSIGCKIVESMEQTGITIPTIAQKLDKPIHVIKKAIHSLIDGKSVSLELISNIFWALETDFWVDINLN